MGLLLLIKIAENLILLTVINAYARIPACECKSQLHNYKL